MPDPAGGLTACRFGRCEKANLEAEVERLRTSIGHAEKEALRAEIERLRDLVSALYLYTSHHTETQLTTEQKELLYDTVEASPTFEGCEPMERWWR